MVDLDLARTSVFVDFNGTVTAVDTVVHLTERLGAPGWTELYANCSGDDASRRMRLLDVWDVLPHDEQLLRDALREVALDPDAGSLFGELRAAGAELLIVSDGLGLLATDVAAALDVAILTNAVDWTTGQLQFPHEERCCACSSCGVCKQAPIKDARYRGRDAVLVSGDAGDYKAALLADVVFAKGALAEWCARHGTPYTAFSTLADVRAALVPRPSELSSPRLS